MRNDSSVVEERVSKQYACDLRETSKDMTQSGWNEGEDLVSQNEGERSLRKQGEPRGWGRCARRDTEEGGSCLECKIK